MFDKILDSGVIPEEWVLSLIAAIYKRKGGTGGCNNYKDIALLSCHCKQMFTNVLDARLCRLGEDNSILRKTQVGVFVLLKQGSAIYLFSYWSTTIKIISFELLGKMFDRLYVQ